MTEPYELRHWHPVLLAKDLGRRPRAVTLHGRELVLFRTASGNLAALGNTCPHRRARLSDGWVEGERVVCPYHGFRYACDGAGESAGTPKMHLTATRFDVREGHGALWVRAHDGEDRPLPPLGREGYQYFDTFVHDIECPLETVLDIFSEVEHTPTTHALFGYRRDSLDHIELSVETSAHEVRVVNEGPQKPLPRLIERAFALEPDDTFIDDWTVRFSPVHVVYDQWWRDPATQTPRALRLHFGIFFSPIDSDETRMVSIIFSTLERSWLTRLTRPLMRAIFMREVHLDRRRVERLADQSPELRGTRLGRFDAPLRELRKRIDAIYRGREA